MILFGIPGLQRLRFLAKALKGEIVVLYFVMKHPQTPLAVKAFVMLVVGYALSPIDLIPDFIPVLGYLDELVLLPLAITLAVRYTPRRILQSCRMQAQQRLRALKPKLWYGAGLVVTIWLLLVYGIWSWLQ